MEHDKKWYEKTGAIILLLVLFFPVGLYLMWKYAHWSKAAKWIVTIVLGIIILPGIFNGGKSTSPTVANEVKATNTPKPTEKPKESPLMIGEEGILNYNENIKECGGVVVVGATKKDLDRITQLSAAKDEMGITQMALDKNAYVVKNCTKIKLISATFLTREVRILDGVNIAQSGWVPMEWVRKP